MQETWIRSLAREDPLEKEMKEMATHSSTLAWEIPGQGNLGHYGPWGYKRVGGNLAAKQRRPLHSAVLLLWGKPFIPPVVRTSWES